MARILPRDPKREHFWRTTLAKWRQSGLNIRDFCRRHRLAESAFYFGRRTIAARDRETARPAASPRPRPTPRRTSTPPPRPSFLPVRVVPDHPLELVLRSGHILRIPPGYDSAHVRAVAAALEGGAC